MLIIDPHRLISLCRQLDPFGSLVIEDGRAWRVRAFRCTSETLAATLEQMQADESVTVDRFPDGYRVRFVRSLSLSLVGDDASASG